MRPTPTLADVAAEAQVHVGTASRALNAATRDMVKPETAHRVREAAYRLGYSPNVIASGFRAQRTASIGVVLPDLTNPLFPPIVRGIEDVLTARGYVTLLGNTDNDEQRELKLIESLRARRVDGFIIATAKRIHPILEDIANAGTPIVLINRTTDREDISSVLSDDSAGIQTAVDHLVQLGHRRIVHLAGPDNLSTGRNRARAFEEAMRRHKLKVGEADSVTCDGYSMAAGNAAAKHIFKARPEATAIVAANDLIALGALQVLREMQLSCPGDVSIVGYNDMPFVDQLTPPLTTIRVPQYAAGVQAAEVLLDRLANSHAITKSLLLPIELVIRGTTAACNSRGPFKSLESNRPSTLVQ
jgi:LacI family transcriptional regulator